MEMERHIKSLFVVLMTGLGACAKEAPLVERPQRRLVIPRGGAHLSIDQHTSAVIEGSDGRVLLCIDDITHRQVMTSVSTDDGQAVLGPTSMHEDDRARFTLDGQDYVVTLERLQNKLIGVDTAEFLITEARPDDAEPLTTDQVIEKLIQAVADLQGAVFLRNDVEHTAEEAANHLRGKWKWNEAKINTPEDFIRLAATRSSTSGQPYRIRFDDGRDVTSAEFLFETLADIRTPDS